MLHYLNGVRSPYKHAHTHTQHIYTALPNHCTIEHTEKRKDDNPPDSDSPLHITDFADKLCSHILSQRFVNWSLFFCVSLNRKPSLRLYVEMCFLSDNIYDYFNVSQGKVTVPSIDDSEEFTLADVSDSRIRNIVFPVTV